MVVVFVDQSNSQVSMRSQFVSALQPSETTTDNHNVFHFVTPPISLVVGLTSSNPHAPATVSQ
jgi:hypothetical protein